MMTIKNLLQFKVKMKSLAKILRILFLALTLPIASLSADYTVVEDQMSEQVKTPSLQNVEKKKIRLENGLEAIVISDPNTPKSGASIAVGAGNSEEPFDKIGLAHFVEHMLFMGTEEYPVEKEYHEFIDQNGGTTNAYTSSNQTVYMFEINNDKMPEAISRFASFFSTPLFNSSGLSRERQAVDHEFTYRTNMDGVRQYLAFLEMTKKDHPLHNWRCGNKETLSDISRDELVEWYRSHYGANKMKLAVYTSLPMNEALAQIDQAFSIIPQNAEKKVALQPQIIDPKNLGSKIYLEPIKDLRSLSIWWEVPSTFADDLDCHTMDLVGDALCEEYSGSLATYLKKEGLIQGLSAGGMTMDDQIAIFQISMELTERGIYQVDTIIENTFSSLAALKKEGIPRYRFDEKVNMAKINYQYQSRPKVFSFISQTSAQMKDEPLETFPLKHSWPTKFSAERNQFFLESLNADEAIYIVMAPNSFLEKQLDHTEKLSQAKFALEKVPENLLNAWTHPKNNPLIGMAPPNPYIPNNLDLVEIDTTITQTDQPRVLTQSDKGISYFSQDSVYQVPEVYCEVNINTPKLDFSPEAQVQTQLYLLSISDALATLADQGSSAGIYHQVSEDPNFGIKVGIYGYSQKSQAYLQEVIETLKNHKPTQEEFARYREKLLSHYENQASKQMPLVEASQAVNSILIKEYVSFDAKLETLSRINYSNFCQFQSSLYDQVYFRSFFYGNLEDSTALQMNDYVTHVFSESQSFPLNEQRKQSILEFGEATTPHLIAKNSNMEGNAALLAIGQGEMNSEKLAALSVFSKAIETPFFDTLRTKQQTGYLVRFSSDEIQRQLFSFFMVLSNSHSPRDLLARFELFNEDFLKVLNTEVFNEEKFNAIKGALVLELEQPERSLQAKGKLFSTLAFEYQGDFNLKKNRITALNNLSFNDFLQFAYTYYGRSNPRRVAALVEGSIAPENALDYTEINNIQNFKTQLFYTSISLSEPQTESKIDEL
ncbi:MAG: Protease 3 [Chlamydiae bacterium]|nr:Protease 3 [Chlamydiota bacterium]